MIKLDKWQLNKHRLTFDEASHTYKWDNQKVKGSVSSVIAPLSPYSTMEIDSNILEAAGVRGSMVHKWIEDHFNAVPENQRQMLASYQPYIDAFLKWNNDYGNRFQVLSNELQLYSIRDGYAGTIDAIVYDKVRNRYGILDFKTNSVKINEMVTAQTAGYARLVNQWNDADYKLEDAFVLYLSKNGEYEFKPINLEEGKIIFETCLNQWHGGNNHE